MVNTDVSLKLLLIYTLRAYFVLTSIGVLVARAIPQLRNAFIPYGKTYNGSRKDNSILQWLSEITVPKAWFWHYYFISVILSVFWGAQFLACSNAHKLCLLEWLMYADGTTFLVWGMMLIQGSRRLYESLFMQKLSSARMWIGHYLAGCAFYVMMSISVLVEGCNPPEDVPRIKSGRNSVDKHVVSAILLFITSSIWQYRCHAVLASLRPSRTTKPSYAAPPKSSLSFQLFLTPHYTAEILIYSAMTLAARNWTMFTALLWVVTNLSVSAGETRIWAHQKFRENEWGRWNIIPFVY